MEPAPAKKLESARERQWRIQREREEKANVNKDALASAGLEEGWETEEGVVAVGETLKLTRPLVVFRRAQDARRYMVWLRSDVKAARDYAATAIKRTEAKLLPKGSKVLVIAEEKGEGAGSEEAIFRVEPTKGAEGCASNLILRQHHVRGRK